MCGAEQPLEMFAKDPKDRAGRRRICRSCDAQASRQRYAKDPAKRQVSRKAWHERNRDAVLESFRRRRREKPHENGEKQAARRKAYKRRLGWADVERVKRIYALARWARDCGHDVSVDHIVPLRGRGVVGLHVACNLRLMYRDCNMKKGHHWWPDDPAPMTGQLLPVRGVDVVHHRVGEGVHDAGVDAEQAQQDRAVLAHVGRKQLAGHVVEALDDHAGRHEE